MAPRIPCIIDALSMQDQCTSSAHSRLSRSRVSAMMGPWTGRTAGALQAALRLSNEAFTAYLGIAVRTVAGWHQKPGFKPRGAR
jgi:DNA-binding transcriptional regulator YiaG